jgi:flagellar basal-body rod protein FlgB
MIPGLFQSGAMPVLERMVQFTSARHGVIANNIANLSTPHFRPKDLSVEAFQRQLSRAVDRRRDTNHPMDGPLEIDNTREFRFRDGGIDAQPQHLDENILFHDRNNRDLERIMQDMVENQMTHSTSLELLKSEFDLLKMAIRGTS